MSVTGVGTSLNTQTLSNQGRTNSIKKNELRKPSSVNIQLKSNTFGGVSFPSGSSLIVDYVNGKKEGTGLVLSAKKTRLAKLNLHEDKVDGFCVFFDSEGMKEKECMYENDVQTGWGCEYKNDKVVFEGIYKNGERYSELKRYSLDGGFMEEMKNGKTLSVCQYNSNHKREGLCYLYENGKMKSEVKYENGVEKRKMKEFHDKDMIELDEEGRVIYKGEFNGSISNEFKRTGRGECMKYVKGVLNEVIRLMNGLERVRCVLKGKEMKEYEGDKLIYEGDFCMKKGSVMRNGIGKIHTSSSSFYTAVYENGIEKRRRKEMNGDVMIDYDEEGRVVYKGGYDKKHKRKGKGQLFEYDGNRVKEVYDSENGERTVKRLEFEFSSMIELNEHGGVVYKGDYKGTPRDGYIRNGEGDEFDKDDMLVYSGGWKKGKREGKGKFYQNGNLRYNGEWKNDKPNGDGKLYNSEGNVMREGEWKNGYIEIEKGVWMGYDDGKLCGLYDSGEKKYEGEWKNGVPHGKGRYLCKEGEVMYEGEWKNGYYHIGGSKWFNYGNDKIEKVISLKKGKIPKCLNKRFSIEEVEDEKTSKMKIWTFYGIITLVSTFLLLLLLWLLYYCVFILRVNVVIDTEFRFNHISIFAKTITVKKGFGNGIEKDWIISGYPFLKTIVVKTDSLKNLKSLQISYNPKLTTFTTGYWSFYNTTSLSLSSSLIYG